MEMEQMDVVGAYLNGELEEEIYMDQPEGFEDGTDQVLRLDKALYGLKQAGRVWNKKLHAYLTKIGYNQLKSDPCVYMRKSATGTIILAIHVDDILMLADNQDLLVLAKKELNEEFTTKDLGPVRQLLGLEVSRDWKAKTVTITQTGYIKSILSRFGMSNAHDAHTPMDPNVKLRAAGPGDQLATNIPYQEAIGSLIYAAIGTRPDIAFAVQALSQFNLTHTAAHWTAVKRVFRYLKGTMDIGITYGGSDGPITQRNYYENLRIEGFSDADWGANPDDRRSISGYAFLIGNGAVAWSSKKQNTAALSSMEAEYLAILHTAKHALWMSSLMKDLGFGSDEPMVIHADNQSAIHFSKDATDHNRTKHIDIRHHFVRDHITAGNIDIQYIHTDENSADIFTKTLSRDKYEHLAISLGVFRT
jgi:hypothetical protein